MAPSAPYVKLIAWARSPLAAAMVAKNIGQAVEQQSLPVYVERFGTTVDEIFVTSTELHEKYGDRFNKLPVAPSASTPTISVWRRACGS